MPRKSSMTDAQMRQLKKLGTITPSLKAHEIAKMMKMTETTIGHWLGELRREGLIPRYSHPAANYSKDGNQSDTNRRLIERDSRRKGDALFRQLMGVRAFDNTDVTERPFVRPRRPDCQTNTLTGCAAAMCAGG